MVVVVVYVGTNGLYIQEERVALTENHEACYRKVLASPLTLVVTRGRWDHDLIPSPIFDIHTSYRHPYILHPYIHTSIHPSYNLFIIRAQETGGQPQRPDWNRQYFGCRSMFKNTLRM